MTVSSTEAPRRIPRSYLCLFTLLYAIQGVVFSVFGVFIQGYLLEAGVPTSRIGLVQFLALLPFALKFLAAPLSDRFNPLGLGRRRAFILLGLILQLAGLLCLSLIHPGYHLPLFLAVALLTVIGLALYDTCTDGFIVDIAPAQDRERIQGLLIFSRFLTATISTLAFGYWLDQIGTGPERGYPIFWACALLTVVPLIWAWIVREPSSLQTGEQFQWEALQVLLKPRSIILLAFGTFYSILSWGVEMGLPLFHDSLGYGQGSVGLFGSLRTLGRALGGLAVALLATRLSRFWLLLVAVLGLAATEAAQGLAPAANTPLAVPSAAFLAFTLGCAIGFTEAQFYVLAMESSDPRMAASTYAIFMAVTNLSVIGSWLFTSLVALLDNSYSSAFLIMGALTLLVLCLVGPLSHPSIATKSPRAYQREPDGCLGEDT